MSELPQFQSSWSNDVAAYRAVRDRMTELAAGLSAEDLAAVETQVYLSLLHGIRLYVAIPEPKQLWSVEKGRVRRVED